MDRLALAGMIVVLVIVAAGIIGAAVMLFMPWMLPQTDVTTSIAISDPEIRDVMMKNVGSVTIGKTAPLDEYDASGYVNISDELVQVPINIRAQYGSDRYVVYVDLNQSKILGKEWYSYRGIPASMDVTIPPGASWYHRLSGPIDVTNDSELFFFSVRSYGPADARIYPIIVNESNFYLLKNGSAYEPVIYIDSFTRQQATTNGTAPVFPGWRPNASVQRARVEDLTHWPAFDTSSRYFIALRNGEMHDVNVSIGIY